MSKQKTFTAYPMQGYWGKVSGIYLSIISLLCFAIFSLTDFSLIEKYSQQMHKEFSYSFFLFGLFMLAFSKEKIEDERVVRIRGKAYQAGFTTLVGVTFANLFVELTNIDSAREVNLISRFSIYVNFTLSLLLTIGYFHYNKWKDPDSTYGDGGPIDNFRYIKEEGLFNFAKKHPIIASQLVLALILTIFITLWAIF